MFIKDLWVMSVTQPSHDVWWPLMCLELLHRVAEPYLQWQMEGLVACPSERPKDIPLVSVTHVAQAEALQGKKRPGFWKASYYWKMPVPFFHCPSDSLLSFSAKDLWEGQKVTLKPARALCTLFESNSLSKST